MSPSEILAICTGGASIIFAVAFRSALRRPKNGVVIDDLGVHTYQAPYPHCDSNILHAPTECQDCDEYPEAQHERIDNDINFTGHHHADKATCPSEMARPLETIERWPGNRAEPTASGSQTDLVDS